MDRALTGSLIAFALFLGVSSELPSAIAAGTSEPSIKYWSFRPPVQSEQPAAETAWARNPVDAFIWQGLQTQGLEPSLQASKERLLRRVWLDLTGLP
ncbi:MAG: DUF1549 domain-containing protein, partial [Bryobacterales bacterium]|nr:DUF1549 domain-containing protein [Bryobacterales bacterium]